VTSWWREHISPTTISRSGATSAGRVRPVLGHCSLTMILGLLLALASPLGIAARFLAFCLVIAGAALMPAPMRATPATAATA
jgi:hypothetical protein